ncbi:AAA family ATPase [Ilumatobacter sp.]|uniref:AAA family ATPase n=1 Tax=Ilumatobacter sp. TaxID=1967498 RepID=UPI003B52F9D5
MRISRIAITNHRRVADFDLDLRGHAALVGPNAVGKSTVLRLIDCLLGATWGRLAATLDVEQLSDIAARMTVEVRLEDLSADDVAHFADKVQVGVGADVGRIWLNAQLHASVSVVDPEKLDISRSFIKPMVDDAAISREDLRLIGWTFLPASRSPDRDLGTGASGAIRSLLQAVSLNDPESTAMEDALKQFDDALTSSPSLAVLRSEFAAELSALFPEPVGKDDVSISLPSASAAEPLNDVSVHLQRDGAKVPLSDQSDGLRSLALVAVQLLARRSARILAIDGTRDSPSSAGSGNSRSASRLRPRTTPRRHVLSGRTRSVRSERCDRTHVRGCEAAPGYCVRW